MDRTEKSKTMGWTIGIALFVGLVWGGLVALLNPIVGGICGGLAALLAITMLLFFQGANR